MSSWAMKDDDKEFRQKHAQLLRTIYANPIKNPEQSEAINNASLKLFNMLKETRQPSSALIKAAAVAYGHCTYITPYTCQFLDKELIPHLRSGEITYDDLRERFWNFKFGQTRST